MTSEDEMNESIDKLDAADMDFIFAWGGQLALMLHNGVQVARSAGEIPGPELEAQILAATVAMTTATIVATAVLHPEWAAGICMKVLNQMPHEIPEEVIEGVLKRGAIHG